MRRLLFSVLILALSGSLFVAFLSTVHSYPQTRAAFSNYLYNGERPWLIAFFFLNEAGSGTKKAFSIYDKNAGAYGDASENASENEQELRKATDSAKNGSWKDKLRLVYFLALGWGQEANPGLAIEWYYISKNQAIKAGQFDDWIADRRRSTIYGLLFDYIATQELLQQLKRDRVQTSL